MKLLAMLLLLATPAFAVDGYEVLAASTMPKVVTITVNGLGEETPLFSTTTVISSMTIIGAGAIISADGFILTCDHLFAEPLQSMTVQVKTAGGHQYRAVILAENRKADLALIKVFPLHPLPYFRLGGPVRQGQRVLSFGAPLGVEGAVSVGFVSKVNATLRSGAKYTMHGAALNPGNSGGPLVDAHGRLVGVNVATMAKNIFQTAAYMDLAVRLVDIKAFLGGL